MVDHRETATTIGVTGQRWRAAVSPWGSITPWNGDAATLDWFIAADDRWHVPGRETAVRQRRIDGTPVVETRVRIPDGDAVQRVWSVAAEGGLTVVEIENDSPLPFVVAFSGIPVVTERAMSVVPIQGIDLPDDAITLPVGHHASIRVALRHDPDRVHQVDLRSLADAAAVARGWVTVAERASRLDVPDESLRAAVIEARCDLMLNGPIDPDVDAIGFVLDVGELVRTGDSADSWLAEIVGPLESVSRSSDPALASALDAASRIARAAGDRRAIADLNRLSTRTQQRLGEALIGPFSEIRRTGSVGRFVNDVERRLTRRSDVLPSGVPTPWLGVNFEFHHVPTSPVSTVSIAVRWHGERPAVLWEQAGAVQTLTASAIDPSWTTAERSGEALWEAPSRPSNAKLSLTALTGPESQGSTSFS